MQPLMHTSIWEVELLHRSKWHPTLTDDRIVEATTRCNLDDPGFCLACGAEAGGCEPDARGYECEACGENQVYGAEECLLETAAYEEAVAAIGTRR